MKQCLNPISAMSRTLAIVIVIWLGASFAAAQEKVPAGVSKLDALRLKLDVELEKLATPRPTLELHYQKQLTALEEKFIKAGDLESVVLVQEESKRPGATKADRLPELQRLQQIYLAERDRRAAAVEAKRVSIYKRYGRAVRALTVSLTKAGDIKGALASDAEAARVAGLIKEGGRAPAKSGFVGHTYLREPPRRGSTGHSRFSFHAGGKATEVLSSRTEKWAWDVDAEGKVTIWKGKSKEAYSNPIRWTFSKDFETAEVYSPFHRTTKKATRSRE